MSAAFPSGRYFTVSGKLQHTFVAAGIASLLASPGVISDSWMMVGIWQRFAAWTTGTVTKPPLENTTSGCSFFNSFLASPKPFRTRKGSVKFFQSKYRRSLPEEMP